MPLNKEQAEAISIKQGEAIEQIGNDIDRILKSAAVPGLSGVPQKLWECDKEEKGTPLCKVKERLSKPDILPRALMLIVKPDSSSKWLLWVGTVGFFVGGGIGTIFLLVGLLKGAFGPINPWKRDQGLLFDELLSPVTIILILFVAGMLCLKMKHYTRKFEYKVFIPIPKRTGGLLIWDHYITSALPAADVELLAKAGDGRRAALASKAASPYQGALTIDQAKIQVKAALADLIARLKPTEDVRDQGTNAQVDTSLMKAAIRNIKDSLKTFDDFITTCNASAITQDKVQQLRNKPDTEPGKIALLIPDRVFRMLHTGAGTIDDVWANQFHKLVYLQVDSLRDANEQYDEAIDYMTKIPGLVDVAQPFLKSSDAGTVEAINTAIALVPVDPERQSVVERVARMTADDLIATDAILGVARATMDNTITFTTVGGSKRFRDITKSIVTCVAVILSLWGCWLMVKMLYRSKQSGQKTWEITKASLPGSYKGMDGDSLPQLERAFMRRTAYNGVVRAISWLLLEGLKYLVLAFIAAAFYFTFRNAGERKALRLQKEEDSLLDVASALRTLEDNGGCASVLVAGNKKASLAAIERIETALQTGILTDTVAGATGTTPIAEIAVYVAMAGFASLAILILVQRMLPYATMAHMKDLKIRAQVGGGLSIPELPDLPLERSAYLDSMISENVPEDVRMMVILGALCSLGYFFFVMIKNDNKYKDILLNADAEDRIEDLKTQVAAVK